MELVDLFPKDKQVQRNYCDNCTGHLDLQFSNFNDTINGVEISISNLPMLYCISCDKLYIPDDSKFTIIYIHEKALENSTNKVTVKRKKTNQIFNYGIIPFIYDSDDYKYIP